MKKYLRIITMILSLAVTLTMFTACGSKGNAPDENAVTFTDALGRDITVEKKTERVAALIGSFADIWVLSGGSVARTAFSPYEIPVGIIMAYLGAPFFVFILIKGKGGHNRD